MDFKYFKSVIMELIAANLLFVIIIFSIKDHVSNNGLYHLLATNLTISFGIFIYVYRRYGRKKPELSQHNDQWQKLREIKNMINSEAYDDALEHINDFSKLEYMDVLLETELPHVIASLIGGYRKTCHEKGIEFSYVVEDDLFITKDKQSAVVSILGNLLDNAIDEVETKKYNKVIRLSMHYDHHRIQIDVFNTTDKKDLDIEKIFQPGFSTKPRTDCYKKDRGYGLAIVQDVVDECDGTIHVEYYEGIEFQISI